MRVLKLFQVGQVRMAVITDGHGKGQLEVESGFGEEMPETRWTPVCHTLKGDKCNYSGCGGSWNGKAWCWIEWPKSWGYCEMSGCHREGGVDLNWGY